MAQTIAVLPWRTRTRTLGLSAVAGRLAVALTATAPVLCGWCGALKAYRRMSGGQASHGICAACAEEHFGGDRC